MPFSRCKIDCDVRFCCPVLCEYDSDNPCIFSTKQSMNALYSYAGAIGFDINFTARPLNEQSRKCPSLSSNKAFFSTALRNFEFECAGKDVLSSLGTLSRKQFKSLVVSRPIVSNDEQAPNFLIILNRSFLHLFFINTPHVAPLSGILMI